MIHVYIAKRDENNTTSSIKLLEYTYFLENHKKIDISKIYKNSYGKPYYDDAFYYNISHSKHFIVIACSQSEVGIDIEEERTLSIDISRKIMTQDETIIDHNILNNWVIKEAYSKYLGMGFCYDFRKIPSNQLLNDSKLKKISDPSFICYVYGEGDISKVEYVNLI